MAGSTTAPSASGGVVARSWTRVVSPRAAPTTSTPRTMMLISTDRQRIAFVLGDFSHRRNTDGRR